MKPEHLKIIETVIEDQAGLDVSQMIDAYFRSILSERA